MTHRQLRVTSSDGVSFYLVEFEWDSERLRITCDCRAGTLGKNCRHKEGLICGDSSLLKDPADIVVLNEVVEWVNQSPVRSAISRLHAAEAELKAAQARVKAAKKALEILYIPNS